MNSVHEMAEIFKQDFIKMWWETDSNVPCLGQETSRKQQAARQNDTDKFIKSMLSEFGRIPENEKDILLWKNNVKNQAGNFATSCLGFEESYLNVLFNEGFFSSSKCFIKEARNFENKIKLEDIFQAIRNVWIMNSIQVFLGKNAGFSPSIFAYSMLYPYTDNYLDNTGIAENKKSDTGSRFGKYLKGEKIKPYNIYERDLFRLLDMIQSEYPRDLFPAVYESLNGIHYAQQSSLLQQSKNVAPYETDTIGITFLKGGMSVLADAYLVNGTLGLKQAEFMFGLGIILQLADDLQDAGVDNENGHMTVFSQVAGKWPLDKLTNKLFNYTNKVMDLGKCFKSHLANDMKSIINYNCKFLIMGAIAKNQHMYTSEYISHVEKYSLYEFRYMKKLDKKLMKEYDSFRKKKGDVLLLLERV